MKYTFNRDMQDAPAWWKLLGEQKGRMLFDVGANVGQAAHHMAPNFHKVISFEPCKESFEVLKAEAPGNVVAINKAVSNTDGFIFLTEAAHSILDGSLTSGSRLTWGAIIGQRPVPAVTLNTAIQEYGTPDVVKVDVEGHEIEVLEGAGDLFGYSTFFVEMHSLSAEGPVRELLNGYEIERYNNDMRAFKDLEDTYYLAATL